MGIWDRLKQVKDSLAARGPQQPPQHGEGPDKPAEIVETDPEADAMEGYSEIWPSELIDEKTCAKCAANDGHEYTSMAAARADYPEGEYPAGGYKHCESDAGCRGTLAFMRDS